LIHTATWKEAKEGLITDIYFERTKKILKAKGIDVSVRAEFMAHGFPLNWPWAVLAGVEECVEVLKDLPVDVRIMKEGTIFGANQPVMEISGRYLDFGQYETTLLGLICQASGIATRAARCKKAAGSKEVISFGARRMHPTIAPLIERNAYIGGCDGVSVSLGAKLIGKEPVGTMPHALILIMGDTVKATKAFDEVIEPKVRRVSLIDTFNDEKIEALNVAGELGKKLYAVRLDTPRSRRGDFLEIMKEVRWELDLRGYREIKLFVDFSMDIIEIDGHPVAKRGKMSGSKRIFRCKECFKTRVSAANERLERCSCGGVEEEILVPFTSKGHLLQAMPKAFQIRDYVLEQLSKVEL